MRKKTTAVVKYTGPRFGAAAPRLSQSPRHARHGCNVLSDIFKLYTTFPLKQLFRIVFSRQ